MYSETRPICLLDHRMFVKPRQLRQSVMQTQCSLLISNRRWPIQHFNLMLSLVERCKIIIDTSFDTRDSSTNTNLTHIPHSCKQCANLKQTYAPINLIYICIALIVNEGPENTLKPIVGVILYILHYTVYIMHYTHARIPMAIVSQLQCTADAGVFISLKWFEINIICNHVYAHAHAYYTMNTHITINQKRTKE